jgi:hypothetical protein
MTVPTTLILAVLYGVHHNQYPMSLQCGQMYSASAEKFGHNNPEKKAVMVLLLRPLHNAGIVKSGRLNKVNCIYGC